jgi:hypothetical protein
MEMETVMGTRRSWDSLHGRLCSVVYIVQQPRPSAEPASPAQSYSDGPLSNREGEFHSLLSPRPRFCRRSCLPSNVLSRWHDRPQPHIVQVANDEQPARAARSLRLRRYALPIRRSSRRCSSWRQRGSADVTHPFAFTFPVRLEEVDTLRGVSGVHLAPTVAIGTGRRVRPARITHLVAVVVRSFEAVEGGFARRFAWIGKLSVSAVQSGYRVFRGA